MNHYYQILLIIHQMNPMYLISDTILNSDLIHSAQVLMTHVSKSFQQSIKHFSMFTVSKSTIVSQITFWYCVATKILEKNDRGNFKQVPPAYDQGSHKWSNTYSCSQKSFWTGKSWEYMSSQHLFSLIFVYFPL